MNRIKILSLLSLFFISPISKADVLNANLTVEMEVKDYCSFIYSFNSINLNYNLSATTEQSAYIYVRCNIGTTYNIEMDYGSNPTDTNIRRMKHKTDNIYLPYFVRQYLANKPLGLKSSNEHLINIGDGSNQLNQFIFSLDAKNYRVKQGSYSDIVRLMVTY